MKKIIVLVFLMTMIVFYPAYAAKKNSHGEEVNEQKILIALSEVIKKKFRRDVAFDYKTLTTQKRHYNTTELAALKRINYPITINFKYKHYIIDRLLFSFPHLVLDHTRPAMDGSKIPLSIKGNLLYEMHVTFKIKGKQYSRVSGLVIFSGSKRKVKYKKLLIGSHRKVLANYVTSIIIKHDSNRTHANKVAQVRFNKLLIQANKLPLKGDMFQDALIKLNLEKFRKDTQRIRIHELKQAYNSSRKEYYSKCITIKPKGTCSKNTYKIFGKSWYYVQNQMNFHAAILCVSKQPQSKIQRCVRKAMTKSKVLQKSRNKRGKSASKVAGIYFVDTLIDYILNK